MGQYRITPDELKEFIKRVEAGTPAAAAGKVFNLTDSTARRLYKRYKEEGEALVEEVEKNHTTYRATITPPVPQNQPRRDWWSRYGVEHDDGRRLDLKHLPDTILLFGDTQIPKHHDQYLEFLSMVKATYQPEAVIHMGDEADLTALKKHFLSVSDLGPTQELEEVIDGMRELFKIFPEAICLTSNHVAQRIGYAQAQSNIPNAMMRLWADVINAPKGWIWRDYVVAGNYLFEHGHLINKGARGSIQEQTFLRFGRILSVVRGHHHSELGDHIKPIWVGDWQQRIIYTGCLMDANKAGYSRAACNTGCVVLVKGVPHPIRMILDKSGRWVGKLA